MAKKRIKNHVEWWSDRIEDLCGANKEVAWLYELVKESISGCKIYEKGPWAFMKLLIVAMYIDIYTNTAKKWFNWILYIDLFAGPGFNRIEELDEVLAGSPLLAQIMPRVLKSGDRKAFDEILLFDLDPTNCDSLRQILPNATVNCCDSNSEGALSLISSSLMRYPRSHYLAFVDPEGLEIKWSTLKALFSLDGDLIINYMYSGVARLFGSYHGTKGKTKSSIDNTLTEFFGTQEWKEISQGPGCGELLFDLYLERIKKHRSRVVFVPIPSEVGGFQYRIIIAVKKTKKGSPWLKPIEQAKDRLERMNHSQLRLVVDIFRKRQSTLDEF